MKQVWTPLPETIWEGAVGVAFRVRRDPTSGERYLTFEPIRRSRHAATGVWSYPHDFAEEHAQALGAVIARALRLIAETDVSRWAGNGQRLPAG